MKIVSVVGARPNFMKVSPIIRAINDYNAQLGTEAIQHVLVHTGQHYDQLMSDSFFADLNLPKPGVHLGVGSGSHAAQTAEIMRKFEDVLLREKPDVLIVVGDVNSTVACAMVAAKISYKGSAKRPIIAHVEAGLRSFDRSMPEEINRILTDQLSDLLFVTEESGARNLAGEGIPSERIHFVGNTMIDSLLACRDQAESSGVLAHLGLLQGTSTVRYALLTLHRPANVDERDSFLSILDGLSELAGELEVIFPAHPRTRKRIDEFGLEVRFDSSFIRIAEPLGYLDFLCLMSHASLVVTDSGGIQEETTCLGVPCVTVRENTERPVTVEAGTNILAGVHALGIKAAIRQQLSRKPFRPVIDKWDGGSANRILRLICQSATS